MQPHVLFSVLSALAASRSLVLAAPVGETDVQASVIEKTVTETTTLTLIREVPMSTTSVGLALSQLPVAAVTGEQGTTVVSPDVLTTSLPPPAVITSEFSAVLPEDAVPPQRTASTNLTGSSTGTAEATQNGGLTSMNPAAPTATFQGLPEGITSTGTAESAPPQSDVIGEKTVTSATTEQTATETAASATQAEMTASADPSQGISTGGEIAPITSVLESGYSILPTVVPTGTMSMSAAEPAPTAETPGGCNATAPAEAGKGKAGLGWIKDSGECASDFLQPGNKVSWYESFSAQVQCRPENYADSFTVDVD
jgi:hypothetical protein